MIRIDFYILPYMGEECLLFSCRLIEKAYKLRQNILIWASSSEQMNKIDNFLWSFRDDSFVPHSQYEENKGWSSPILLSSQHNFLLRGDLIINFTTEIPSFLSGFSRMAEIVGNDEHQQEYGRKKYREYKNRGYPLFTHKI